MKHSLKILLVEFAFIIVCLFCLFVFKINYWFYLGALILSAIGVYFLLKVERRKERFNTEVILVIIISILFYYAITNFIGFFSGFYYSTYSKSLKGILFNVISCLIIVFSIENIRETLIRNNAYHKSIVWLTPIICSLLEIPSLVAINFYASNLDIFNIILSIILPCVIKNMVLTFITYKSSKYSSIIYQLFMLMPCYFLPVFPNFGDFFSIIINITLPVVVLILIVNITTVKFDKVTNSRKLASKKYIYYAINASFVLIISIMLYLTSNMFRFTSLAIGSESMTGSVNKGDVVVIDKKLKNIKKGDVIAFVEDGRFIVHRVVGTKKQNNVVGYVTKGDLNNDKDGWVVNKGDIKGKVIFKVKWIGWPTVLLCEFLQGKEDRNVYRETVKEENQ